MFDFSREKNEWLIAVRGIGFDVIIDCIEQGKLVDILQHPDKPHQRMLLVNVNDYIWVVPTIWETKFMKTAFPSRKMTKKYLRGEDDDDQ